MESQLWMLNLLTVLLVVMWIRATEAAVAVERIKRSLHPWRC